MGLESSNHERHIILFLLYISFIIIVSPDSYSQQATIDSLRIFLSTQSRVDTNTVDCMITLGYMISERGQRDSGLIVIRNALALASKLNYESGKVRSDFSIGQIMCATGRDSEQGLSNMQSAIAALRKIKNNSKLSVLLHLYGRECIGAAKHDEAMTALEEAKMIAMQKNDRSLLGSITMNLGVVHFEMGRLSLAAEHFSQCLKLSDELGRKSMKANALMNLANTFSDHAQQLPYYLEATKIFESIADTQKFATLYLNIGINYMVQQKMNLSIEYLTKSLSLSERFRNNTIRLTALYNLALVYHKIQDGSQAIRYANLHHELSKQLNNKSQLACSYILLGNIDLDHGQYHSAISLLEKGYNLSKEVDEWESIVDALNLLVISNEKIGASQKALEYFHELANVRDSVSAVEKVNYINELKTKYETDEKQNRITILEKDKSLKELELNHKQVELHTRELEALSHHQEMAILEHDRKIQVLTMDKTTAELSRQQAENEKKKNEVQLLNKENELKSSVLSKEKYIRNSVVAGMIVLVVLGVVGYRNLQNKRRAVSLRAEAAEYQAEAAEAQALALQAESERKEKESQRALAQQLIISQEQERKRIAAGLHDSLGQELLVIKNRAMMALQNQKLDEDTKGQLNEITTMVSTAITDVQQISRDLRPYQLDRFGLTAALQSIVKKIVQNSTLNCTMNIEDIDALFAKDDEINVYRIVQESMNNILKHSRATEAEMTVKRVNGTVEMIIRDNGKGFDVEAQKRIQQSSGGFGLLGINERVQMMNGKIKIHSSIKNGTQIEIKFPVSKEIKSSAKVSA